MSDSVELKQHLAQRYGFKVLPHAAEHAAYGGTLETCIDLQILKRSSHNDGINLRHIWWPGFNHYTSLIFNIAPITDCLTFTKNPFPAQVNSRFRSTNA